MRKYHNRAMNLARIKLMGAIHWKRRGEKHYMFLGDYLVIKDGKSDGLSKAIMAVWFDDYDIMTYKIVTHPRAPEIFMNATFHISKTGANNA